jgi:hypothetical protein
MGSTPRRGGPAGTGARAANPLDRAPQKSDLTVRFQSPQSKETSAMRRFLFLCVMLSVALSACENSRNNTSWSKAEKGAEVVPPLKTAEHADTTATDSVAADSSQSHK